MDENQKIARTLEALSKQVDPAEVPKRMERLGFGSADRVMTFLRKLPVRDGAPGSPSRLTRAQRLQRACIRVAAVLDLYELNPTEERPSLDEWLCKHLSLNSISTLGIPRK